jgi:hypothetical protein
MCIRPTVMAVRNAETVQSNVPKRLHVGVLIDMTFIDMNTDILDVPSTRYQ